MSKIHLELLDKERQKVFQILSFFKNDGYLAGETALALQINHRHSKDFDIFIDRSVDNKFHLKVEKIFGKVSNYINTSDQISFKTTDGISVTFVWYFYKPIYPLVKTNSLSLVSVEDIAADKSQTIGRRAVWRDYVDIFILLKKENYSLENIIKLAKKKFQGEFIETQFLEQLRYFDDLQDVPMEYIKEKYTDEEIKFFLQNEVKKYLKKIIK